MALEPVSSTAGEEGVDAEAGDMARRGWRFPAHFYFGGARVRYFEEARFGQLFNPARAGHGRVFSAGPARASFAGVRSANMPFTLMADGGDGGFIVASFAPWRGFPASPPARRPHTPSSQSPFISRRRRSPPRLCGQMLEAGAGPCRALLESGGQNRAGVAEGGEGGPGAQGRHLRVRPKFRWTGF